MSNQFSIRGPERTLPFVVLVQTSMTSLGVDVDPMLIWAMDQAEADRLARAWCGRREVELRVFRVTDPSHHLGRARVVQLEEQ